MSEPELDLTAALRRYWGYDAFRQAQEQVVRSLLAGHDVAVVMPTGGGKSLCYQLPALLSEGTAVVVSPLIALMQDQVAQLEQMGVSAGVVNSTVPPAEQAEVMRRARRGDYRLLYLSPERLAREDTVGWLGGVPVSFFVIDEAHCISEWGHEFRPEYRQLSTLREKFPDRPIAAFTASATKRVRHDILQQLRLRDPHTYIRSFHRENLRYLVRQCDAKTQSRWLVDAVRALPEQSVIVYASTIAKVEETAALLGKHQIDAVIYHGQMNNAARRENQERWMSDEVRVLVGTLAFGLGINKPAVRAVIHLALPKSLEQFYQEAGRAGRDGLPADCALLWQKRDAGLLAHFITEIEDSQEQQRAWGRYREIRGFAEGQNCRHRTICLHFGEKPKWEACGHCDVCGSLPEWLPAEDSEAEVALPARRRAPRAAVAPPPRFEPRFEIDATLRERLRVWRRETARRNGIPAFIVLHDTSLDDLCRRRPTNVAELLQVSGIGERKAELYGSEILEVLGTKGTACDSSSS